MLYLPRTYGNDEKKNGKYTNLEYLNWYVAHGSKRFLNYERSPQLSISFSYSF